MKHIGGAVVLFSVFVLATAVLFSCSGGEEGAGSDGAETEKSEEVKDDGESAARGEVIVASKIDTEGALLGSIIVQLLRSEGFEVEDKTQFGPTDVMRKAIQNGEIDLYPEYTGNGAFFFSDSDKDVWKDAKRGYETVRRLDKERNGLIWLEPAPANNTWAIAVREDLAQKEGLESLEDLGEYLRNGGEFKLAASEEFVTREDVLPAFEEAYGFDLSRDQLLTFSSGNTAQTEKAAARRTDGVNAAMAYGTDGQLSALGLKVLDDTENVMPIYRPAPLLREEIYTKYPSIESILEPVFAELDRERLQKLNSKIAVEGLAPNDVAKGFLKGLK